MATDDAHRGGVWMVRDPHHSLAETISIGSSSCLGRLPDESLQATRPAIPVRLGAKVRSCDAPSSDGIWRYSSCGSATYRGMASHWLTSSDSPLCAAAHWVPGCLTGAEIPQATTGYHRLDAST